MLDKRGPEEILRRRLSDVRQAAQAQESRQYLTQDGKCVLFAFQTTRCNRNIYTALTAPVRGAEEISGRATEGYCGTIKSEESEDDITILEPLRIFAVELVPPRRCVFR